MNTICKRGQPQPACVNDHLDKVEALLAVFPPSFAESTAQGFDAPDFSSAWTSVGPLSHTVNTYCREGEPVQDCVTRHKEKVEALAKIWPPI